MNSLPSPFRLPLAAFFLFSLLLWTGVAHSADPIVFENDDDETTLEIAPGKVTVAGSGNTILIQGECTNLVVTGSNNTITLTAVGHIALAGDNNNITWASAVDSDFPTVDDQGKDNKVQAGTATND